jgi:hypothetical protein
MIEVKLREIGGKGVTFGTNHADRMDLVRYAEEVARREGMDERDLILFHPEFIARVEPDGHWHFMSPTADSAKEKK